MANFKYNRTTLTKLKAVGYLDLEKNAIIVDDEPKSLDALFSDFNECLVDLSLTLKDEEDLDDPTV